MDYLTVCAIVKDEPYLPEWIAYHLAVGVERFLIYDNMSTPAVAGILAGAAPPGVITVVPIYGNTQQMPAYGQALTALRGKTVWCLFIDGDEAIVPNVDTDCRAMLKRYENSNIGAVAFNWQMFGANGHDTPPPSQIHGFTRRAVGDYGHNRHVKSCAQVANVATPWDPHCFNYKAGFSCVGEDYKPFNGPLRAPTHAVAQINHYFLRSKSDWAAKCRKGAADGTRKPMDWFASMAADCSAVVDLRASNLFNAAAPAPVATLPPPPSAVDIAAGRAVAIQGWMALPELRWLAARAAACTGPIIEVGSWLGRSTMALSAAPGPVYAVDHWLGSKGEVVDGAGMPGSHALAAQLGQAGMLAQFKANLRDCPNVVAVCADSAAAVAKLAALLGGTKAAMCFIDSGHTYAEVAADIAAYRPLLAPGGLLCGHDYALPWAGVMAAVDKHVPNRAVMDSGSIWYATV